MDEQDEKSKAQPAGPHEIELDYASTDLETIEVFVEESSDPEIFEEILRKNDEREEVVQLLYKHPNTPHNVRVLAASALNLPVPSEEDLTLMRRRAAEQKSRDMQKERLIQKVAKMTIAQKVKIAMKGNSEVRSILARDSNKLVLLSVLDNPRITDGEILALAKNRSTPDDAIREIMKNREWMKSYSIMYAIAIHPKTPPAIAMRHLPFIKKKDIKLLAKSKSVTEAVRTMAKKLSGDRAR